MSVRGLCARIGMSRQNYYKARESRQRRAVDVNLVRQLVEAERALQPRIGGLKLHAVLKDELAAAGVQLGREVKSPELLK